MRRLPFIACLPLVAGCAAGHSVGVVGEAGLLAWATEVWSQGDPPADWAAARFAVGYPYPITALLTDAGRAAIVEPQAVVHRLRDVEGADAGVVWLNGTTSSAGVLGFDATAERPGVLYLEASYGGEVVDVAALQVIPGPVRLDPASGEDPYRW